MFSPNIVDNSNLVDQIFIVGVGQAQWGYWSNITPLERERIKPEILFTFPENKIVTNTISLEFAFPNGFDISIFEEKPKFYALVLTNEKGMRSYLYVLQLQDKITIEAYKEKEAESKENLKVNGMSRDRISLNNSSTTSGKSIYLPVAICISSHLSNIDFFKRLFLEIYKIISLSYNNLKNITEQQMRNFQKGELLNYFNFIFAVLQPPHMAKMCLNFRFSSLSIQTPGRNELPHPHSDVNIEIMFSLLETTSIIKLWVTLLLERPVIILANQNMALFAICESLMGLLFPFKWLHTYIPNLPYEKLDYLEAPFPYLMGLNSSYIDALYLNRMYPNYVICDANTSQIYGSFNSNLPLNEELKLKRKLLLLKNRVMTSLDEIESVKNGSENDEYEIEDMSGGKTFSENVHNIFFRFFRNNFSNIKRKFIQNNIFNAQSFLNEYTDDEYRHFFEKVISTSAFEYFVLSMQYLDDSYSRVFNTICKAKSRSSLPQEVYSYEFSVPSSIELEGECGNDYMIVNEFMKQDIAKDTVNASYRNSYSQSCLFYGKGRFIEFFINASANLQFDTFKQELMREVNMIIKKIKSQSVVSPTYSKLVHIPNEDSAQFYLLVANYFKQYGKFSSSSEMKQIIFDLVSRAFDKDKTNFPRIGFFFLLQAFSYSELKSLAKIYHRDHSHKLLLQIINCNLRKLEKTKYKNLILHDEQFEGAVEDDKYLLNYKSKRFNTNPENNADDCTALKNTQNSYFSSSPVAKMNSNSSNFFCESNIGFNMTTTAEKIVDEMKPDEMRSMEKIMKVKVINNYQRSYQPERDPIALSEEIAVKLYSLLIKWNIEKYSSNIFELNVIREISKSQGFVEVKALVASLQKVNLSKITQNNLMTCFWLNLYNFLTIFTIIYKGEMLSNYYEWYRFLKNSYFAIGGYELSLYEIENCILRNSTEISTKIYGECPFLEVKSIPKIDTHWICHYGISIPSKSSPSIRIYFPGNLHDMLKLNTVEYFSRQIQIDFANNILTVPEYILWIDPNFVKNILNYNE